MAVLAHADTRGRGRITAVLTSVRERATSAAARLIAPHTASLTNLRDIPLTVAGTGSIDFAAFHLAHGWGWLVTGISLILLEHIIADDEER